MRLDELFLSEAIKQDLAERAAKAVSAAFMEFVRESHPDVSSQFGFKKYEDAYKDLEWGDESAKMRDRIFDNFSTGKLIDAQRKNDLWYQDTILELKHVLELTLQDVTREYIEDKYGEIETGSEDANLHWLQHIVVNLDFKGSDDFHPEQKADSGGYFDKSSNARRRNFLTRYGTNEIDWENDSTRGIKIYANQKTLWEAYAQAFYEHLAEVYYGEAMEYVDPIEKWMEEPLSTFVHEVVHLEQEVLVQKRHQGTGDFPAGADRGMTLLPYPGKPRANGGGRRGGNVRSLADLDPNDPNYAAKWADYLASPDEIEAHAAGAAAKLILGWVRQNKSNLSRNSGSSRYRQDQLNAFIDMTVDDFKQGYVPTEGSIYAYERFIKSKIGTDRAYQKVWNRFVNRLVRHLLSHKTAFSPTSEWEREDQKEVDTERNRNKWGNNLQNRD